MDKSIAKQLKAEFDKEITHRLPQFEVSSEDDARQFGRVYRWKGGDQLCVFVLLLVSQRDNRFTLEIAWSPDPSYPIDLPIMVPLDAPKFNLRRGSPIDGRFRFRLAGLFHDKGDYWWQASNKDPCDGWDLDFLKPSANTATIGSLADNVSHAVRSLEQLGIPYVQKHASRA
jgi:hypothetical protein